MKKDKGITLIAVIITIIIMLILAVITLSFVIGNSGIFSLAQNAIMDYKLVEMKESDLLYEYTNLINKYNQSGNMQEKLLSEEFFFMPKNSIWKVRNVKEALDYLYNN